MKITKIQKAELSSEEYNYIIIMEDGTRWDLETMDNLHDDIPWMVYLGVCLADDADELREQAKTMVAFANVIDAIGAIIPDVEVVAEDDDHELCYWYPLEQHELETLISHVNR